MWKPSPWLYRWNRLEPMDRFAALVINPDHQLPPIPSLPDDALDRRGQSIRVNKRKVFFKPRTTKAFPSYKIEFQCILVSCMHPFYFVYFQNTKLLFPAASHPPAGAYLAETGKSSGAGGGCGPRRVLNLHINIGTCGAEPGTRHPAHLAQAHTDLDMRVNTIIINIFHGLWNF